MIKNGDNMKKKTILSILIILIIIVGVIIFHYDKSVCINSFKKENVSKISKNKSFLKENIVGDKIELEGVYKLFGINKESCD